MAAEWWSEADNALLVANMNRTDCRGESPRFCCAYHEGVADGITAKGAAERDAQHNTPPDPTPGDTGDTCAHCDKPAIIGLRCAFHARIEPTPTDTPTVAIAGGAANGGHWPEGTRG